MNLQVTFAKLLSILVIFENANLNLNLKNKKDTLLKPSLLHGCFSCFFELCKWYQFSRHILTFSLGAFLNFREKTGNFAVLACWAVATLYIKTPKLRLFLLKIYCKDLCSYPELSKVTGNSKQWLKNIYLRYPSSNGYSISQDSGEKLKTGFFHRILSGC